MEAVHFFRHYLAVLNYRCTKAIADAPANYPELNIGHGTRRPIEILAHISNLLGWARSKLEPEAEFRASSGTWVEEMDRFYREVRALDDCLSGGLPDEDRLAERLLQGPLADAMTHVGQLAMMRRMAGDALPGENFFAADIAID